MCVALYPALLLFTVDQPSVRRAIESHLLDNSPAVRDAAVELIGKYMIDSPAVAGDYYQKIAERIAVSIEAWIFNYHKIILCRYRTLDLVCENVS